MISEDAGNLSDLPRGDDGSDVDRGWEVAGPYRFHQKQVLLFCEIDEFFQLGSVGRECLFAENVFASSESEEGILVVVRVGCGDIDDIDVWVFY